MFVCRLNRPSRQRGREANLCASACSSVITKRADDIWEISCIRFPNRMSPLNMNWNSFRASTDNDNHGRLYEFLLYIPSMYFFLFRKTNCCPSLLRFMKIDRSFILPTKFCEIDFKFQWINQIFIVATRTRENKIKERMETQKAVVYFSHSTDPEIWNDMRPLGVLDRDGKWRQNRSELPALCKAISVDVAANNGVWWGDVPLFSWAVEGTIFSFPWSVFILSPSGRLCIECRLRIRTLELNVASLFFDRTRLLRCAAVVTVSS